MKFEISHRFKAPAAKVIEAFLDGDMGPILTQEMTTILEIETLSREDDGKRVHLRNRYLPVPLIKRVGPKKVDPKWMEWVAELDFDLQTGKGTFRNVPTTQRVAALMENHGTITVREEADGTTVRTLSGELKIKVALLGRIAEKIIQSNAEKILAEEASILQRQIDEGRF